MGIINATPDSFYSDSRCNGREAARQRVRAMLSGGVDMIDVGACSTRPGAPDITADEEYMRLADALEGVRREAPDMIVSVDTWRSSVARRCIEEWGVQIVNDVSGGTLDPDMFAVVAELKVPYVLMHMRGTPADMQSMTDYSDVTAEVLERLARRLAKLRLMGVAEVIVDPGFGFAKTLEQNYALLAGLHRLTALGCPVLAGLSRKSMIWRALDTTPDAALAGTVALEWECLRQGAAVLRAHDVRAAAETIRLFEIYRQNQ